MEDRKVLSFGYEDTDKKLEIELYGLVFEIRNLNSIEELENLDKNNYNSIEEQLEKILGKGSIEKINNKRRKDGYQDLDINIELNILGCIMETYAKSMTNNTLGRVLDSVNDMDKDIDNVINNNFNRNQRRNYNRNQYRRNRNYRRY